MCISRRSRKILLALIASIAGAILIVAIASVLWPARTFSPEAWSNSRRVARGERRQMADDLMARRLLNGKTRAEVLAMLGEPSKTGHFADWDLVYWLGPERAYMSIDSEWLVLRFDPESKVGECRIVRD